MSDRETAENIRRMVERNKKVGNAWGKFQSIGGRECAEGSARALGMSNRQRRDISNAVLKHGERYLEQPGLDAPTPMDHIGVNDTEGRKSYDTFLKVADKLDPQPRGEVPTKQPTDKDKDRERETETEKPGTKRPGGRATKPCTRRKPEPLKVSRPTRARRSGGAAGILALIAVLVVVANLDAIVSALLYLAAVAGVSVVALAAGYANGRWVLPAGSRFVRARWAARRAVAAKSAPASSPAQPALEPAPVASDEDQAWIRRGMTRRYFDDHHFAPRWEKR